ncbi:unnamed protein product [Miscanthus lutarioriparius]|nr:unnamed protein product [Miscanthus lutarioriparius]
MAALQVRLGELSAAAAADAFSVGEHGLLLADLSPARPHGRSAWRCCRASLRRTLASDALLACVGVAGGARTPSIGEGAGRCESGAAAERKRGEKSALGNAKRRVAGAAPGTRRRIRREGERERERKGRARWR